MCDVYYNCMFWFSSQTQLADRTNNLDFWKQRADLGNGKTDSIVWYCVSYFTSKYGSQIPSTIYAQNRHSIILA